MVFVEAWDLNCGSPGHKPTPVPKRDSLDCPPPDPIQGGEAKGVSAFGVVKLRLILSGGCTGTRLCHFKEGSEKHKNERLKD